MVLLLLVQSFFKVHKNNAKSTIGRSFSILTADVLCQNLMKAFHFPYIRCLLLDSILRLVSFIKEFHRRITSFFKHIFSLGVPQSLDAANNASSRIYTCSHCEEGLVRSFSDWGIPFRY